MQFDKYLNLNITKELELEGVARDIIRELQKKRKDLSLDITENIEMFLISKSDFVMYAIKKFQDILEEQTLSKIVCRNNVHARYAGSVIIKKNLLNIYIF